MCLLTPHFICSPDDHTDGVPVVEVGEGAEQQGALPRVEGGAAPRVLEPGLVQVLRHPGQALLPRRQVGLRHHQEVVLEYRGRLSWQRSLCNYRHNYGGTIPRNFHVKDSPLGMTIPADHKHFPSVTNVKLKQTE